MVEIGIDSEMRIQALGYLTIITNHRRYANPVCPSNMNTPHKAGYRRDATVLATVYLSLLRSLCCRRVQGCSYCSCGCCTRAAVMGVDPTLAWLSASTHYGLESSPT